MDWLKLRIAHTVKCRGGWTKMPDWSNECSRCGVRRTWAGPRWLNQIRAKFI